MGNSYPEPCFSGPFSTCTHSPLSFPQSFGIASDSGPDVLSAGPHTLCPGEKDLLVELRVGLGGASWLLVPLHYEAQGARQSGWEARKPHNRGPIFPQAWRQSDRASLCALKNSPQPAIVLSITLLNHLKNMYLLLFLLLPRSSLFFYMLTFHWAVQLLTKMLSD